jgi:arginyl-tRNA synthetase
VKADDLLDRLEADARKEVEERNPELVPLEVTEIAHQIAVGALRYFLLKFTRTAIIAFDFKDALNLVGETGPYLQYAAVRAGNIMKKMAENDSSFSAQDLPQYVSEANMDVYLDGANDIWELVYTASRLDEIAAQVVATLEPATLAKHSFMLAQKFNLFYHQYKGIIEEKDQNLRMFYLAVVELVRQALGMTFDMMGMQTPRRM